MLFTIRDIAETICTAERRSDREKVFLQVKGLQARGLMTESKAYGPRGALLFDPIEVVRARLLMVAIDSGVRSDDLAKLNAQMSAESKAVNPVTGASIKRSLSEVIKSVGSGKGAQWHLEVLRVREFDTGELGLSADWVCNGERFNRPDPLAKPKEGFEVVSVAGTIEAVLTIPASDLIRPLIDLMED